MYIYTYIYMCIYTCTTYRSWMESVELSEQLLLRALLAYRSQRLPQATFFKSVIYNIQKCFKTLFKSVPITMLKHIHSQRLLPATIPHEWPSLYVVYKIVIESNLEFSKNTPRPTTAAGSWRCLCRLPEVSSFLICYVQYVMYMCPKILKFDL